MNDERERARLFVALELPAAVQAALVAWRAPVLAERPGLRAVDAKALHVTLCFLGSRYHDEIADIAAACRAAAEGLPGGSLVVGEAVWLPPRRPGVLAVGLEMGEPAALAAVQRALSAALHAGGWYTPEARPFLPHVTVARVRRGARVRRSELVAPEPSSFRAETVTLFHSRLGSAGARYEALASVALGR